MLISFSAVYVRLADVAPARAAFLRCAYALPAFAVLILWSRRRAAGAGELGPVLVPLAVVAGCFLALDLVAWHASIGIVGAGIATVLPNLQVVFVGAVGVLAFRERPAPAFWAALPVVAAGVWLLSATGKPVRPSASVVAGVGLGVVSAGFYSGYLVLLRLARLRLARARSLEVMASATLGGALVAGAVAGVQGVAGPAGEWRADGWLVALALGSQVGGWVMLSSSIHHLPAALTSVALLLQPVLALAWGAMLLGEPIGAVQVLGAATVLTGVAIAHRGAAAARLPAALAPEPATEAVPTGGR